MDALIIKPMWLDRVFHNGKTLKIRGSATSKRGMIALAESGSTLIRGSCKIYDCYRLNNQLWKDQQLLHQSDNSWEELLQQYPSPHAWVLQDVKEFETLIPYVH